MTDDLKKLMDIEVKKMSLRPGDALVFQLGDEWRHVNAADFTKFADDVKSWVSEKVGQEIPVLVLGTGTEVTVLRKDTEEQGSV